jgi:hypothetical protein
MQTDPELTSLANTQIKHLQIKTKYHADPTKLGKRVKVALVIITDMFDKVTTRNGRYVGQKKDLVRFTWKGLSLVVPNGTEL